MKSVFITGASGFVGGALCRALVADGWRVLALCRTAGSAARLAQGVEAVIGDPTLPGPWQERVAGCQAAVNLAGASIFGRWSAGYKELIRSSRLAATANLVQAVAGRPSGAPFRLVSASAVGYYGFGDDEELDEASPPGDDFLARVCQEWEAQAMAAEQSGAMVAVARFGVVLGSDGGALGQMLPLFRLGLGGRLGHGRQWLSWIHQADLAAALKFLLERPELRGSFNCCAPHPVTNRQLAKSLGRALGRPAVLPAPAFAVRLALGQFGSVLLEGQKALPKRLRQAGFRFAQPTLDQALADLLPR